MTYTPGQLATDILHLNLEQYSKLTPREWTVKLPDDISSWMFTRDKVRQAGMASYLILQISELGPSFPAAMKKVCKAGAHMSYGASLESIILKMLIDATIIDRTRSIQYMGFIHQALKTHGKTLCRILEERIEGSRNALFRTNSNTLLNGLEVNRETIGLYCCVLLFGIVNSNYDSGVRNEQREYLLDILIKPMFEPSSTIPAGQLANALRLVQKHSQIAARGIAILIGEQLSRIPAAEEIGAEANSFIAQLFSEQKVVEGAVYRIVYKGFQALKDGKEAPEVIAERVQTALHHIRQTCNKHRMDNAIVSTMKSMGHSSSFDVPDSASQAVGRWALVVQGIMAGAFDASACWWSILNEKDSINDYLNLQKSRNAILRTALSNLNRSFPRAFMLRFSELAILNNYHEKSINLLVHNMPDGEKVLQDVYKLVGDQMILSRMNGQSRREVLIHDLDL